MSVVSADLDGDGDVDLVTANSRSDTVTVLRNNGDGTFAAGVAYAVGSSPASVTSADLDDDGDVDLMTANFNSNNVTVLHNNGDSTFAVGVAYAVGFGPLSVTSADLDGDGNADLVTANFDSYTVTVLRNSGNGTFAAGVAYAVGSVPNSVTAADLDGDGDVDLVTASSWSNSVTVLLNGGSGDSIAPLALSTAFEVESAQQFVVTFNEPIDPASVDLFGVTATRVTETESVSATSVGWSSNNTVATFTYVGLANGNYRLTLAAVAVADVAGNELATAVVYEGADVFVLAGDATRDRAVNFADLLILAQNYGQTGRTYSQGNIDYSLDGLVGFNDLLILAQRYGTSLIRTEPKPGVFGSRSIGRRGLFEAEEAVIV
jgi:hypothetical protein